MVVSVVFFHFPSYGGGRMDCSGLNSYGGYSRSLQMASEHGLDDLG